MKKAITAAALGNAMEWFDFGVYGFVAYALGKVFFPNADPSVQMIAALATFSVPFLIRPLGGLFFGALGDKFGRQKILAATIVIMSLSTFAIGLIPSYASIGIWAPILLLLAKMAQGFSVGASTPAPRSSSPNTPRPQARFLGSWLDFGSIAGFVLGAGVVVLISTILGEEKFLEWGWRLPFFLALPLGIIGLYLRHALEETPAFQQHVDKLEQGDREGLASGPGVVQGGGHPALAQPGDLHWRGNRHQRHLLHAAHLHAQLPVAQPALQRRPWRADHHRDHGRHAVRAADDRPAQRQVWPSAIHHRRQCRPVRPGHSGIHADQQRRAGGDFRRLLIIAVLLNFFIGVMASTLPAMFPTHIRYSALAAAFNISVLIAGLTPTLAAWLVESTGDLYMPAYYLMVIAAIGLLTGLTMKETANKPLRGAAPAASDIEEARELLQEHHDNIEQKIEDIDAQIAELEAKRQTLAQQHPRIE
jgi:MHS family proline/betaine transporter-like MFS transporter